jgi:hypothetical protein
MHTAKKEKKEKLQKEKSRYSDLFLVTAANHHQDSSSNPSTPKAMPPRRKQCTSAAIALINDHRFSPRRKSAPTKQCLQQGHCQAQPIKARPWAFTLQD